MQISLEDRAQDLLDRFSAEAAQDLLDRFPAEAAVQDPCVRLSAKKEFAWQDFCKRPLWQDLRNRSYMQCLRTRSP